VFDCHGGETCGLTGGGWGGGGVDLVLKGGDLLPSVKRVVDQNNHKSVSSEIE
jgi:hypothetical protein